MSLDTFSHVAFTSRNGVAGVLSRLAALQGATDGSCMIRLLGSAPNASHDPGDFISEPCRDRFGYCAVSEPHLLLQL